eukprot:316731-Prorocentrum_minimum.AAC.1
MAVIALDRCVIAVVMAASYRAQGSAGRGVGFAIGVLVGVAVASNLNDAGWAPVVAQTRAARPSGPPAHRQAESARSS